MSNIIRSLPYNSIRTIAIFLLLSFSVCGYSIETEVQFKHLTVDDGLSQSSILAICQDSKGFMWFGTRYGLNRYDGYNFKKYFHNPDDQNSLWSNEINNLLLDSKNRLWIATQKGVNLYNWDFDEFLRISFLQNDSLFELQEPLLSISENQKGEIMGCTNKAIYIFDEKRQLFKALANKKPISNITTCFQDRESNLYIGTSSKLLINWEPSDSTEYFNITFFEQFRKDTIWFNMTNYLVRYIPSQKQFKKYDIRTILKDQAYVYMRQLIEGKPGELWVGTYYGIVIFNIKTEKFEHVYDHDFDDLLSLSDNSITKLYKDKNGDYWVGTFSGGLNYLEDDYTSFAHYKHIPYSANSLNSNIISSIEEDPKGNLVIGTGRGGINVIDRKNKKVSFYYTNYNIRELVFGSNGNLFVGTYLDGLLVLDSNYKLIRRYYPGSEGGNLNNSFVHAILEDSHKRLWVSAGMGLNLLEPGSNSFKQYLITPINTEQPQILEIFETKKGEIILGSSAGVYKLYENTGSFTLLFSYNKDNLEQLPDNQINGMIEDRKGNWWIATMGGLVKYNPVTFEFTQYTFEKGLSSNAIYSILEDHRGTIWISTSHGINSINSSNGQIQKFDVSHGLQGNEFRRNAKFKCRNGELLFGGGNGFNIFHPDKISFNEQKLNIVFTDLILANDWVGPKDPNSPLKKELIVTERLMLNHKHNNFSIRYKGLSFKSSHKNTYAYYLEGFEKSWNYVGNQRVAKYTNLKPGNYILRVKAANNDGVWNEQGTSLQITVVPALRQTLLFRISLAFILVILVILIFNLRLKQIRLQKKILAQKVAERTLDLEKANQKIEERKNILIEQKEELQSSKEEILAQKDQILLQMEELERHRNNLEELVKERTIQFEEEKTKAQRADALKTAFLANMSHEIRTPLNAIMGFSELICEEGLPTMEKNEMKEIISSNTETLLQLIDDILDLSKIESNQLLLFKSDFNLNQLLEDLNNIFEQENNHKQKKDIIFKLNLRPENNSFSLHTDSTRLKQVLLNLFSNALKFTDKGIIESGYTIKNDFVEFYVKDTGIGIAEDEKEVIFDRFRKLEKQNRLYRGTGLGLAISQKIISLLDGKIWLESEPGIGSTFYFTIPINQKSESIRSDKIFKQVGILNLENHTILIVEDDETNYNLLQFLIKKTGAKILWAKDGQEAFELYKQNENISLILMDIKMPRTNGYEAFMLIKALERKAPPIVAQTAYIMNSEKEKIKETGFSDYISKPINKDRLYSILAKLLG